MFDKPQQLVNDDILEQACGAHQCHLAEGSAQLHQGGNAAMASIDHNMCTLAALLVPRRSKESTTQAESSLA
eukprot:976122-Amphidinium_carterae.1